MSQAEMVASYPPLGRENGRDLGTNFRQKNADNSTPDGKDLSIEQRLLDIRTKISNITEQRIQQLSDSIDYAIDHPSEVAKAVGEIAKKTGKNIVTWGAVGFVMRGAITLAASSLEVVGRPVAVVSSMAVRAVRDSYTEWKDHKNKSGRMYFRDHIGVQSFTEKNTTVLGNLSNGIRTVSRGLVDTGLKYAYKVEKHKNDVEMLFKLTNNRSAEEILNQLRNSDSTVTQQRLMDYMKLAKLGIDTATDNEVRKQARSSMQKFYQAALVYGNEDGKVGETATGKKKIWNDEVKREFKAMSRNINVTLNSYSDDGLKLAIFGRIVHTPVTAGISALIGGIVFEHTIGQSEWYRSAQKSLHALFQSRFDQVTINKPAVYANSAAYVDAYTNQVNRPTNGSGGRFEPPAPPTPPTNKLPIPMVDANEHIKKTVANYVSEKVESVKTTVAAIKDQIVPPTITVKKGDGLFDALNKCGFKVTKDGSGAQFVTRIATTAFNPSEKECEILNKIVAEDPTISADRLRIAAIQKGMDFDKTFTVYAKDYVIPGVELSHVDVLRNTDTIVSPDDNSAPSFSRPSVVEEVPVDETVRVTVPPVPSEPIVPNNEGTGVKINTIALAPLTVGQSGVTGDSGVRINAPQTLQLGVTTSNGVSTGVRIQMPTTINLNVATESNTSGVQINTINSQVPVVKVEDPQVEVSPAPITTEPVAEKPSTLVTETVPALPEWYKPYAEFDKEKVRVFGMDWSSNNLSKIAIKSNQFLMDNKIFKLFRYEENGLRTRLWDQQLESQMKGNLHDEWIQYDPVKNNLVIYTHASGDTFAENVRMLVEGVDKAGSIPPYGNSQIADRMNYLVNSEASIDVVDPSSGINKKFDLSNMFRWENNQLDSKFTHQGNYFNFFKDLPGENKIYVVFCGAYYSEAMKLLTSPNISITDANVLASIQALNSPTIQGDSYIQHLSVVLNYLKNAPADSAEKNLYTTFVKELYSPKDNYERLSYTRYVMEFSPVN